MRQRDRNIEFLRREMIRIAEEAGSFTHPEVLAVSQQLDCLIVEVQRAELRQVGHKRFQRYRYIKHYIGMALRVAHLAV